MRAAAGRGREGRAGPSRPQPGLSLQRASPPRCVRTAPHLPLGALSSSEAGTESFAPAPPLPNTGSGTAQAPGV